MDVFEFELLYRKKWCILYYTGSSCLNCHMYSASYYLWL